MLSLADISSSFYFLAQRKNDIRYDVVLQVLKFVLSLLCLARRQAGWNWEKIYCLLFTDSKISLQIFESKICSPMFFLTATCLYFLTIRRTRDELDYGTTVLISGRQRKVWHFLIWPWVVLVGTWWYLVTIGQLGLMYDNTGSARSKTGWYMIIMGH